MSFASTAKLIINQLGFSASRLAIMTGAKNFSRCDENKYVAFRFTAKAANRANYCKITLEQTDTYTVEFGYIRGFKYTVRSTDSGVYNDMLKSLFESKTGLRLSL